MSTTKTVIEVGGNQGQHTGQFVKPDTQLYCFEPVQELAHSLWQKYRHEPNVVIVPFAIDTESAIRQFNVAGQKDWGCSSFHEFSDNLDKDWPGRTDFKFTHSYNVLTIRLDTFCELYNIETIDYLWIDAQGHDFQVLKSLGEKIKNVKAGRCEASNNVKLYKDVDNSRESIQSYLHANKFNTEIRVDSSPVGAECDVHFTRI